MKRRPGRMGKKMGESIRESIRESIGKGILWRRSRRLPHILSRGILSLGAALLLLGGRSLSVSAAVDLSASFAVESDSWENWPAGPQIQGDTAVVLEPNTGTILYSKGMDAPRFPASITKIMTTLIALENCDLNGQVTMTETGMADAFDGSSNCHPQLGEVFTVEQCLQMIMIKSANDVATQMAEYTAGSVDAFAELMNQKAAELGCRNTHFCNASGLENDNHYTSAYDMALIMRAALQKDKFREIIGMQGVTIPATNLSGERYYETHVQMMVPTNPYYYEGCVGGKTGYTDISKSTLVVCAQRNGMTLIGVVMGGQDSNLICDDMADILDYGFDNFYQADVSNGSSLLGGGTAILPNYLSTDSLSATSALGEDGNAYVFYSLGGQAVGSSAMNQTTYETYRLQWGLEALSNPEDSQAGDQKDGTGDSQEETPDALLPDGETGGKEASAEGQKGSGTKLVLYLVMGLLGILIVSAVAMIFVGAGKQNKRKRRKR